MTTYLIIGDGAAGNAAAQAIRKHDPEGPIHMFSKEKYPFYYTPALPEYLAGEKELGQFTLHHLDWFEENRIDLHLDTEITRIDPEAKAAVTRQGEQYRYDKLLLATGGYSFVPPIKGADQEGVYTLRTYADAETIRQKAKESRRAVLIGGGLLGLEAGNGLRKAGLQVTVVEFFPRLLPRQMDVPGAAILQKQLEVMGTAGRGPGAHFRGGAAGIDPGPGPGAGDRQRGQGGRRHADYSSGHLRRWRPGGASQQILRYLAGLHGTGPGGRRGHGRAERRV